MAHPIGVGLLGLGTIGTSHARALDALRDRAQLIAYSGGTPERAADAGWPSAEQGAPEDVVIDERVDVVALATPSALHAQQALGALDAGKHVVVEKPLAMTAEDAELVVERAARLDLQVAVMSQRRLEPEVVALREALEAGLLGAIRLATTHVHWWRDPSYYEAARWRGEVGNGGSLLNQGVHNVDLLSWLAGPVHSVTAQQGTLAHATEAEDTTVATVRFTSGALGLISTSTATPPGSPATLTLHCERGVVEIGQGEILRWDVDGVPAPRIESAENTIGIGASNPNAIGIAGHIQQWDDVLTALATQRTPSITGRDGADTVRLLDALTTAAATGRLVTLQEHS
jgi:UDP-N-acetyl-2-amino-2-deoxyglucuronate dehydrogenase